MMVGPMGWMLPAALPVWMRPLGGVAAGAVLAAVALALVALAIQWLFPRVAAVARVTAKEATSQPLFALLMALGIFALILFPYLPYNTFGDDIKLLKDEGLTLIMLLATFLAVWTASTSIADEIEGRTAMTVLSKPIGRREFVLGKFLGVLLPVAVLFLVLGTLFLASVSFKVVYDARESALPTPTWRECAEEIQQIAPGLALAFMAAVILASIAVAVSMRLPLIPNLLICASVYVLGNLLPTIVAAASGTFEIPYFFAQLLAAVLPVLEVFNVYTAVATNNRVPLEYLVWPGLYCVLYTTLALLLALLLFEDRDLA